MTPERWRRVEELFHAAREREAGDREMFLARECADDAALLDEVRSLLEQAERDDALVTEPGPAGAAAARLEAGARVGPYEILERVGAGGMGEVYRARHTQLDRIVALKIVKDGFAARFEREARAIARLSHRHICALYDMGAEGGVSYLAMEFLVGKPPQGPMPWRSALKLGAQIADALETAHQSRILHRDLKPSNILITADGAKLLDFGLAKFVRSAGESGSTSLTATGQIVGTLAYLSPEQAQGLPATAATDIFGLGLVLYEMLTGRRAFEAASEMGIVWAILRDDAAAPSSVLAGIPPEVDRAVLRCLEKAPERRWGSAGELRDELRGLRKRSG